MIFIVCYLVCIYISGNVLKTLGLACGCDQCVGSIDVVSGEWIRTYLRTCMYYLIMKYPTFLVSVRFGRLILTFCSNFVIFLLLYGICQKECNKHPQRH